MVAVDGAGTTLVAGGCVGAGLPGVGGGSPGVGGSPLTGGTGPSPGSGGSVVDVVGVVVGVVVAVVVGGTVVSGARCCTWVRGTQV